MTVSEGISKLFIEGLMDACVLSSLFVRTCLGTVLKAIMSMAHTGCVRLI